MSRIEKVGILGGGQMGLGIAQVTAKSGFATTLVKATPGDAEALRQRIAGAYEREVEKGRMRREERDTAVARLRTSTAYEDLGGCDLVIESIVEDIDQKLESFARLDEICSERAIFASNTSTLGITAMAVATRRPERFIGLHFFNPAPAMKLVEVATTLSTDPEVVARAREFATALGKTPIVLRDSTGFVVNRLLVPYLLDAMNEWARGTSSIEDIDTAMCNGAAHPMGPFTLADFIGLDVVHEMAANLQEEYGEPRFAPPPILRRLVLSGQLGRKSKKGFYDYSQKPPRPNPALTRA